MDNEQRLKNRMDDLAHHIESAIDRIIILDEAIKAHEKSLGNVRQEKNAVHDELKELYTLVNRRI